MKPVVGGFDGFTVGELVRTKNMNHNIYLLIDEQIINTNSLFHVYIYIILLGVLDGITVSALDGTIH
jgi:hypothetical protein